MEKDRIALLLEKYWNAETTIEEEKLIKQHFSGQVTVEANQREVGEWFTDVANYKSIVPEERDFVYKIGKTPLINILPDFLLKIAATVLLVTSITLAVLYYNWMVQIKQALAIRKKAESSLLFISKELNQGYSSFNQSTIVISRSN